MSGIDLSKFNPSEDLLRAIALHIFNGGSYFITFDGETFNVWDGVESEAWAEFEADIEGTDEIVTDSNFAIYCSNNLSEIEEMEVDEDRDNYICLTDSEADEKVKENILDSIWAFRPSFLSSFTGFDVEVFEAIQNNGRCESNNSAILSMIEDEDGLVSDAISADGRGHFMSSYDGNENEQTTDIWGKGDNADQTFYIYRIN
jgi:hypothetical protein